MLKRHLGTLFIVSSLILATISASLGAQSTITVNPTSGSNAQTAINNAIKSVAVGATSSNPGYVLLTAGTYEISGPIILQSNVVLKGAGDSTVIYADSSVCNSEGAPAYIFGSSISNCEISYIQFKSNAAASDGGRTEYKNCIKFSSCSNCSIHDILFSPYLYNDGVRAGKSSGIQVYNCRVRSGHDGIEFLSGSSNCRAYNNDIDIRINTGIRFDNSKGRIDHNTFYGLHGSGWCCTEMENSVNVEIDHNIFHDYKGSSGSAAVQPVHASGTVSVHDNILWNVGSISMGTTSNNKIDPSDQNVENWVHKGYGYGSLGITADSTETTSTETNSKDINSTEITVTDTNSTETISKEVIDLEIYDNKTGPDDSTSAEYKQWDTLNNLNEYKLFESQSDLALATLMLNSSEADVQLAKRLTNGSTDEKAYAEKLLVESKTKKHYSQVMFNLSINNLNSSSDLRKIYSDISDNDTGRDANNSTSTNDTQWETLGNRADYKVYKSQSDLVLASIMLNSSIVDVQLAQKLANDSEDYINYAQKILEESQTKRHYSQVMFNLSISNLEASSEYLNKTINGSVQSTGL